MANIPTPRSYNQILGDMVDSLLSRYGFKGLKRGNPVLSILEAAAQSDLRSSQDIWDLLNSISLNRAKGIALDRIAKDENTVRISESPASGLVTISDTSFTKISSKVYQGQPAPIVGSAVLYVTDASSFPSSGSVYIGRGTSNYEGPLTYGSKVNAGTYWTLNLSTNTQKFHNLGESVIVAQGGNRLISAGTIVQTPQGNTSDAVQFITLYSSTIPDGETEITAVTVVAQKPGVIGNVIAEAINDFVSDPFTGASVSNPLPFSNGLPTETDDALRERIKAIRQSRSKGTALSIETAVTGITATDENKRISSAVVVTREGYPTTLFIDDGTGYEERSKGTALETLVDRASGGEDFFQVSIRPITKASLTTTVKGPWQLLSASTLAIKIGGIITEHTFDASEFRNIENATPYEVAASINGDSDLLWAAATADAGTNVTIFSKGDANEDIEITSPSSGEDANEVLLFPSGRVDTLRLYKNDRLLSKDGKLASLTSKPIAQWGVLTNSDTLTLAVDGTAAVTYTFTDQDFIDGQTGFTTVGVNTIAAWVTVFNLKVPGITASESSGLLVLTSNAGRSSRAQIAISGGTLVTKQMFASATDAGTDSDYTLNRNTGQIHLSSSLDENDTLGAGTSNTRAFIESEELGSVTLASQGDLYFVIDGAAALVSHGMVAGGQVQVTEYDPTPDTVWGKRVRYTATSGTPFTNIQVGDWVIIKDTGFAAGNRGVWRVAYRQNTYFEVERSTITLETATLSVADGLVFVRSTGRIQKVSIAGAPTTYTAANFVTEINADLTGAKAEVYRTNQIRVRTNTYGSNGDIALVATNTEGAKLKLPVSAAVENTTPHLAAVESGTSDIGTPVFALNRINSVSDTNTFVLSNSTSLTPGHQIKFLKNYPDPDSGSVRSRWGSNQGVRTGIEIASGATVDIRTLAIQEYLPADRNYLASPMAIGPTDSLVSVVDQDTTGKRFSVPLWRKLKPKTSSYGTSNEFKDADNGNGTLATAFGLAFDFTDFAVHMAARVKTHEADATKSALWRYKRLGPDGEKARLRYVYPESASAALIVSTTTLNNGTTDISVQLPSGALRTGYSIRSTTKLGLTTSNGSGSRKVVTFLAGFSISSAARTTNVTTLTLAFPAAFDGVTISDHGLAVNDIVYVASSSGSFTSGLKTITARTASTIDYAEVAADVGATPSIGTVSFDTAEAKFNDGSPTVALGDVLHVTSAATFSNTAYESITMRVSGLGAQFIQGHLDSHAGPLAAAPSWQTLGDASAFQIYPLANNTVTAIVAAVNALDSKCPVSATVLGTGTDPVTRSSSDEAATANTWFTLVDGLNWIRSVSYPATLADDYGFTFKKNVDAGLATGSDWINEEVRIVPITSKSMSLWLSSQAVTGLSSSATVETSSDSSKLQIASLTAGSAGAIQVQGGSGNTGAAAVTGTAVAVSTYSVVTLPKSDCESWFGGMWLVANNTEASAKTIFTSSTSLASINTSGVFVVTVTPVWSYANAGPLANKTWRVEKQGSFVCYSYSIDTYGALGGNLTGVEEGDWVRVTGPSSGTATADFNSLNQGIFRVVRTYSDSSEVAFWIENENAVEEDAEGDIAFFDYNSIMPGDVLSISTDVWGSTNKGSWTVEYSGGSTSGTQFTDQYTFKVSVANGATSAVTGPVVLGSQSSLVKLLEAQPSRLFKQIRTISPNQSDANYLDVKLESSAGFGLLSATAGTVFTPLDRLLFSQDLAIGIDGYKYSTGLIAQANKVCYGDPGDPATYPGQVAAGAKVNISGPLVKRISLALSIRKRSGIAAKDIESKVRSAVAAVINKTGLGQDIAISDVIGAARKVSGVIAVSILSPSYSATSDLIEVQPYEKPLVLNLEQDVTISFVGA